MLSRLAAGEASAVIVLKVDRFTKLLQTPSRLMTGGRGALRSSRWLKRRVEQVTGLPFVFDLAVA